MTEKLRKEHEKFEKEIDAGDHGTNSLARSQLAGRVYNDLQDSDWAKKLFEKSLAEVKEENADDKNIYYDNLSGIANEIYNSFDKEWAEKIFTEILDAKNISGIKPFAWNLASGEKADENSKKRAKEIFLKTVEPEFLDTIPEDEKINHITEVASNIEIDLGDVDAANTIYDLAEKNAKTSSDFLAIGYCFVHSDSKDRVRAYFDKAKDKAATGQELFEVGLEYNNQLEDKKTAKDICIEALARFKADEEEDKKYHENQFKEVFGK